MFALRFYDENGKLDGTLEYPTRREAAWSLQETADAIRNREHNLSRIELARPDGCVIQEEVWIEQYRTLFMH